MKAHQDYAFVRLIARVPGSFSKHLSFPHPFSLSASAYILFIYLGFNTSSCDLQARGISFSISTMPHTTLLQLNICLTEGCWELHASFGTLSCSLCGRSKVFQVFKGSWDTPENRDLWRFISCAESPLKPMQPSESSWRFVPSRDVGLASGVFRWCCWLCLLPNMSKRTRQVSSKM